MPKACVSGSKHNFLCFFGSLMDDCAHHSSTNNVAMLCRAVLSYATAAGARSTAGREGPVVGRPVRHSGSRPLLLNEILEHWADEIKSTCLLRWSLQAGCSSSELEQQMREAYEQVNSSCPHMLLADL
jgi:myo-inositol catabolism protein IolC